MAIIHEPTEESVGGKDVVKEYRLVYKCKICATRNMVAINQIAWNEGTVIGTCQGCFSKHLLADSGI